MARLAQWPEMVSDAGLIVLQRRAMTASPRGWAISSAGEVCVTERRSSSCTAADPHGPRRRRLGLDRAIPGRRDSVATALYAGTFDPVTYGHIDVVRRAAALFDK